MAKLTIYLPDDLAERLEAHRKDVQVSGVCQEAIERKLTILDARAEATNDIDEVVARLRHDARHDGSRYGTQYAKEKLGLV